MKECDEQQNYKRAPGGDGGGGVRQAAKMMDEQRRLIMGGGALLPIIYQCRTSYYFHKNYHFRSVRFLRPTLDGPS